MNDFMVVLVSCSIGMSLMTILFLVLVSFCQKKSSPGFFYYLSAALLVGFAIPFRVKIQPFLRGQAVPPSKIVSFQENIATTVQENALLETGRWHSVVEPMFLCWMIVAAAILIYFIVQHVKFTRTLTRWIEADKLLFSELKVSSNLKIVRCKCIVTPMLVQLDQPTILLPNENYSPTELALIIQHEQVHFLRKDWLLRGVMIVAVAIHWFNPLIYILARQMTKWCEISCDEKVIKNLSQTERYKYADLILETVRRQTKPSMLSSLLSGGKRDIQQRLSFIVEARKRTFNRGVLAVCLFLILGASTAISIPINIENYVGIGKTEVEANAEMRTIMSETFNNEFKESDFAGMTIRYDKKSVPIVSDPNGEVRSSGFLGKTKKRMNGFYSTSDCDKDSLYFQIEKDSPILVTDSTPEFNVVKVRYAGKTGYMKKKNITFN